MSRRAGAWLPLLALLALTLALGACGQKGPLYLPNAQRTPVPPSPGAATPQGVSPEATPLAPAAQPRQEPRHGTQPSSAPQQQNSAPQGPTDPAPASGASPAA